MLDNFNKINDIINVLPYCVFGFLIWCVFITVMLFLVVYNVIDIHRIVEAMRVCIM